MPKLVLAYGAVILAAGCGGGGGGGGTVMTQVAMPNFSLSAGTYTSAQSVTLSDMTSGATIYYTTDGNTPTSNSTVYRGAITVSSTETIEAIAVASGYYNSAVASAAYTITLPAAIPTISFASGRNGARNGAQLVSLSDATPGAAIYYTVDGTTPTTFSQIYEAPFLVASNLTVNAVARATGYPDSSIASQVFAPGIPSGTLVWSEEFDNSTASDAQPNPLIWTYDTGAAAAGTGELQYYCAWARLPRRAMPPSPTPM